MENEKVSVKVSKHPGCQIALDITLLPGATATAYKKAIKKINKNVSIPGFRKGKAPEKTIIANYGKHVDQEWGDEVAHSAFDEAVKLVKIFPLHPAIAEQAVKKIQVEKLDHEVGGVVHVEFECEPEVPEIKVAEIKVQEPALQEVTDAELEKALQELAEVYIDMEPVEGRAVEAGDFVDLDIDILGDKGGRLCEDRTFEVADGKMGQWLQKLVVGKSVGDEVEGASEWEESSGISKEEFESSDCRITVKKIQVGKRPEVGDELATKVGLKDEAELRDRVKEDIIARYRGKQQTEFKETIEAALLESYDFEVPQMLFEEEREHRLKQRMQAMKQEGIADDMIKEKESEMEAEVAEESRNALRMFFLARELISEWNIPITKDELQQELSRQLYMVPPGEQIIGMDMQPDTLRRRLTWHLVKEKVKQRLTEELGAGATR